MSEEIVVESELTSSEVDIDAMYPKKKPKLSELEQYARTKGWNPNFEGEGQNKTAVEFLDAGDGIMRQASQDVNELKGKMNQLIESQQASTMEALAVQRRDIEANMREAVSVGDTATYDKHRERLDELQAPPAAPAPSQPAVQTKFDEIERRFKLTDWYDGGSAEEMEMTVHANSIANGISARYAEEKSVDEIQVMIESAVKRAFPQRFANPQQKPSGYIPDSPSAPTATGTAFDRVVAENPGFNCEEYFIESGMKDKEEWASVVLGE